MIIALEHDDGSLFVFASIKEAEVEFETLDVENGEYEFRDETGQLFLAEIAVPVTAFCSGSYRLLASATPDREALAAMVSRAKCLERGVSVIQSIEDLWKKYLA